MITCWSNTHDDKCALKTLLTKPWLSDHAEWVVPCGPFLWVPAIFIRAEESQPGGCRYLWVVFPHFSSHLLCSSSLLNVLFSHMPHLLLTFVFTFFPFLSLRSPLSNPSPLQFSLCFSSHSFSSPLPTMTLVLATRHPFPNPLSPDQFQFTPSLLMIRTVH